MKTLGPEPAHALAHKYATALLHDEPSVRVVAFRLDPHQLVPEHSSPSTVLLIVTEGSGSFSGAAQTVELQQGQAVVYEPGEPHSIRTGDVALSFLAVITPRPS